METTKLKYMRGEKSSKTQLAPKVVNKRGLKPQVIMSAVACSFSERSQES